MAKKNINAHVLAVLDYDVLMKEIKEGTAKFPGRDAEAIIQVLTEPLSVVKELKNLGKFVRKVKAVKKEVAHYWEGLILDGYTLLSVEHEDERVLRLLCDGEKIKLVE